MRGLQYAVAGKADDGAVNLLVSLEIVAQFAAAMMPFDPHLQRLEALDVLGRHADRGKLGRAALDAADGFEQFSQFLTPQGCYDRAAVELQFDQALGGELLQGLAQRRA